VGTALSHLVKGLDFEEAAVSALLLAALVRYRKVFDVEGDTAVVGPLLQVSAGLAALATLIGLDTADVISLSYRLGEALALLTAGLSLYALYLWLRPVAAHLQQTVDCRRRAERIVAAQGLDTLSFFSLRDDKSYFFSPSGRSFLAYRVLNGVALVSGDPIGEHGEVRELIGEFRRIAQSRGWRIAVLAASERFLPLYRLLGLRSVYLGDEAVVVPERFSLDGRPIRKVRQSVSRLERAGYRMRVLSVAEVDDALAADLRAVSGEWRGRWPERGFTMAMDCLFAPETLIAVAEGEDGQVGGFVHLVPVPGTGGYSLASMRRRREIPNGLMEFLLAQTIAWARERGVPELSLNFSVFGQTMREPATPLGSAFRFVLLRLDRFFQLERLLRFNRKFFPEWRARYICVERRLDFPLVGLAYLRAESLLTPPGPWVRARDLATR
jgi:lysyl-tRNA synthetase class 2